MRELGSASALRLMDANANRALEGLRVCEDVVRFHLEDQALYRRCRKLRHGIAEAMRGLAISPQALIAARDSRSDIGRAAPSKGIETLERLMILNLQRAKESLRVLEECSRVVAPSCAHVFQKLRFGTYDIERALFFKLASLRDRRRARRRRA